MHARTRRLGLSAAGLTAMLAVLAGCSLLNSPISENTTAANDAAAAKFVACLTTQGQTAKILHGGVVGMLLPQGALDDTPPDGGDVTGSGGGSGMTSIIKDDDGEWQASDTAEGYPEDGGMREAWAACEAKVPAFKQPKPDPEGNAITSADQMKRALAFAKCARKNGYADFPDPDDDGSMNLPSDITEDGFRSLLDDCFDPSGGAGLMLSKAAVDNVNFDLRSVLDDFFADHPEYQAPAGGQHEEKKSGGNK